MERFENFKSKEYLTSKSDKDIQVDLKNCFRDYNHDVVVYTLDNETPFPIIRGACVDSEINNLKSANIDTLWFSTYDNLYSNKTLPIDYQRFTLPNHHNPFYGAAASEVTQLKTILSELKLQEKDRHKLLLSIWEVTKPIKTIVVGSKESAVTKRVTEMFQNRDVEMHPFYHFINEVISEPDESIYKLTSNLFQVISTLYDGLIYPSVRCPEAVNIVLKENVFYEEKLVLKCAQYGISTFSNGKLSFSEIKRGIKKDDRII